MESFESTSAVVSARSLDFYHQNQGSIRRVNFTQHEKLLLLSLVEKNKNWLVNNCIDPCSVTRKKGEVWREITRDFNMMSKSYCPRDTRQLRKCWENLKTRYRKNNRQQAAESRSGPTPAESSGDAESTLENEMLFQKISVLVEAVDNRSNAISSAVDKTLTQHSDMEQQSLSDLVFGENSDRFSAITDQDNPEPSAATNSIVKIEVPEAAEKRDSAISPTPQSELADEGEKTKKASSVDDDIAIVDVSSAQFANKSPSMVKVTKKPAALPQSSVQKRSLASYSVLKSGNETLFASSTSIAPETEHKRLPVSSFALPFNRSNFKTNNRRLRPSPSFTKPSFAQARHQAVDTEKILRNRYLRNRIREQETRLRMMQQRMRHERERHEAMMTLLHKKSAHYEQQINRLQDHFNDDSDFNDDWMLIDP